ncbi:MAG TPA: DUF1801 domain-containing protein [Gemmatimonadaceae bacterium]
MSAEVAALLADLQHPREAEIRALRAIILAAAPGIAESVKWNAPSYATTEHFATFHLRSKAGVQVVLHLGAKARPGVDLRTVVADPAGLLEWRGADRATVTFRDLADIEAKRAAFTAVVRQWLDHV